MVGAMRTMLEDAHTMYNTGKMAHRKSARQKQTADNTTSSEITRSIGVSDTKPEQKTTITTTWYIYSVSSSTGHIRCQAKKTLAEA